MVTRDDIIRMGLEAGATDKTNLGVMQFYVEELERFAALVAAATRESMKSEGWRACAVGQRMTQHCGLLETAVLVEREACARVCQELVLSHPGRADLTADQCAAAIRARGEEQTPDYLEKCPNCNGPADNGFDRSWPDPNPYYCTKCMKAME